MTYVRSGGWGIALRSKGLSVLRVREEVVKVREGLSAGTLNAYLTVLGKK